jgi:hypothetical protein
LRHYCTECPNFADGLEDIQIWSVASNIEIVLGPTAH